VTKGKPKKKKFAPSEYDLKFYLDNFRQRISMGVWREDGYGEYESDGYGSGEWAKVTRVVEAAFGEIDKGAGTREVIDFIMRELFPKVDMPRLLDAMRREIFSYNSFESRMAVSQMDVLPEYIDYFIQHREAKG